ncbi:MAG: hypothetical protein R3B07_36175 [Polyangiaceae bacterium]
MKSTTGSAKLHAVNIAIRLVIDRVRVGSTTKPLTKDLDSQA